MTSGFLIALYGLVIYFLFSLTCMMVTLRNSSTWWIAKKLRLGAILLSISPTLMIGCPPPPTARRVGHGAVPRRARHLSGPAPHAP